MFFKRHISFFAICVMLTVLLSACGDKDVTSSLPSDPDNTSHGSSSMSSEPSSKPSDTDSSDTATSSNVSSNNSSSSRPPVTSSQSSEPHLHAWRKTKDEQPTCTKAGFTLWECSCGDTRTEYIDAKGHSWGEWQVTKDPTYTTLGERERVCTVCGASEREEIAKLSLDDLPQEILKLVNEERAKAGLGLLELKYREDIQICADTRATELTESPSIDEISHTRPNGTEYFTVFTDNGITYKVVGENIAAGQSSAQSVMEFWMNSDGHKNNILSEDFTGIAVGVAEKDGVLYWVQLFIG